MVRGLGLMLGVLGLTLDPQPLSSLVSAFDHSIPVDPLTAVDPFNAYPVDPLNPDLENLNYWTNDRQPPPETDLSNRKVYLPTSGDHPYSSFFTISGRPCGYLYTESDQELPEENSQIRLSASTAIAYLVVQTSNIGLLPTAGRGVSGRRSYAYICATDGKYHSVSAGSGRWVANSVSPAELGLPLYVDGGILAPPQFYDIPSNLSRYLTAAQGCEDHVEWRSFDSQFGCQDYGPGGQNEGFCTDLGFYDPSVLDPLSDSAAIRFGIPAYLGCPFACGNCYTCEPWNTSASQDAIARNQASGTVEEGCALGFVCQEVVGAGPMVGGERLEEPRFPVGIQSGLESKLKEMAYNCTAREPEARPLPSVEERRKFTIDPSIVRQGWVTLRVIAPSQGSEIRYTLDGTEPSLDNGVRLESGSIITIQISGQLKARAVRPVQDGVTVKQSRVVQLPYIRIQNAVPEFRLLQVGHYLKAQDNRRESCDGSFVTSKVEGTFRIIKSNGCPSHHWQTEDARNVALHQAWEFRVPTEPVFSQWPLQLAGVGGPIGVASDGVPFFAPARTAEDAGFENERDRRDECGGIAMSVSNPSQCETGDCVLSQDYHGQYHYRGTPRCINPPPEARNHSGMLGYMLDGIPIYGPYDLDGEVPQDLDECGGHTDSGRIFYHYHSSTAYPYTVKCLKGCIDVSSVNAVNMELANSQEYCHPSVHQSTVKQPLEPDWISTDSQTEEGLLMAGNYSGSVSVEILCEPAASGGATVRYTTDGSEPVAGGAPGQGYGLGSLVLVISESTTIKARCEAPETDASFVATSGRVDILRTAYNPHWAATVGYFNFTDPSSFFGTYSEGRSTVQGVCSDSYDTKISPAFAKDISNRLGSLQLAPPECKSKVDGWDVLNQPSLNDVIAEVNGVQALVFGGPVTTEGLRIPDDVTTLVAESRLPHDSMSLELWASITGSDDGALASVVLKDPGFLGKGFYLVYEQDTSSPVPALHTITFVFGLSAERNNNGGRGGLATVRSTFPKLQIGTGWTHIVATYDGSKLSLYINGMLEGTNSACAHSFCGPITYPVRDDTFVHSDIYFRIGISQILGKVSRHSGAIAYLRMMREPVSLEAVRAGYGRLAYAFRPTKCTPGHFGPYDGLEPCSPCQPGTAAAVYGMSECESCKVGYFASESGAESCNLCPAGILTPSEGASSEAECTGPDYCSIGHNCNAFAVCESTPGSFSCTCSDGFQGDGVQCSQICGDGKVVEGEECDDGNDFNSDGCDGLCRREPGFSCTTEQGRTSCECILSVQECCVRSYGNCLSSTVDCESSCLHSFANCLKEVPADENQVDEEEAGPAWLDINATQWDLANTQSCNRNAMKACRLAYSRCRYLSGNEDAADEDEACTTISCVASYSQCMQDVACDGISFST